MKKLALIGMVSALAMFAGQAVAYDDDPLLGLEVQDIQVPVDSSIAAKDVLNGNTLFSNNTAILDSFNKSESDVDVTVGDVMVNLTSTEQKVEGVAAKVEGGLPLMAVTSESGRHGDNDRQQCCASQAWTGNIYGNTFDGTRGIYAQNYNTGLGALSNSISINAKVNQ